MGKSLERLLSNMLGSSTEGVFILNQLSRRSKTRNFVAVDNREASCTEQDIFYINTYEISGLENFLDIDGLYKIDIGFTDGRNLVFEYYEPVKMQSDYDRLLYWFERRNLEDEHDIDTGIWDSDSDDSEYGSDSEDNGSGTNHGEGYINHEEALNPNETPEVASSEVEFKYYITSRPKDGMTPSVEKLYMVCDYYLYFLSSEPQFSQGDILLFSGSKTLDESRIQTENGRRFVCVNVFKRQKPITYPVEYLYEFTQPPMTFHYNWEQANAEEIPDGFERWAFRAFIDERTLTYL